MGRPRLKKAFAEKNARRHALIDKELSGGGLTPPEESELADLQKWCDDEVSRVHPLPFDRLKELEEDAREAATRRAVGAPPRPGREVVLLDGDPVFDRDTAMDAVGFTRENFRPPARRRRRRT